MHDQLGDFFGAPKNAPPPYVSQGDLMGQLPTYKTSLKEPTTLARFTFFLGFGKLLTLRKLTANLLFIQPSPLCG